MTDFSSQPSSSSPPQSSASAANPWDQPKAQSSYVDDYAPPAVTPPVSSAPASSSIPPAPNVVTTPNSQALEDQNIFQLLGVMDATEDEKEAFLDELQQVIWEDFIEHDVDLLLTEEELAEFKKIGDKPTPGEEDRQAEMIAFLEKLIPDLEKIMLEKALELKEEMLRERISQLTKQYQEMPDKSAKVQEALKLVENQQWRAAAEVLNGIAV